MSAKFLNQASKKIHKRYFPETISYLSMYRTFLYLHLKLLEWKLLKTTKKNKKLKYNTAKEIIEWEIESLKDTENVHNEDTYSSEDRFLMYVKYGLSYCQQYKLTRYSVFKIKFSGVEQAVKNLLCARRDVQKCYMSSKKNNELKIVWPIQRLFYLIKN